MDIIKRLEQVTRNETPRKYIGASGIGHPCVRKIWYEYHKPEKAEKPIARSERNLMLGHKIEELVIQLFKMAGIEVLRPDQKFCDSELEYLQGHVDGILPHENMVLEIKSCKDSSFKLFKKKGLKEWWGAYYPQVQCYLAFTNLPRALVIAFNKDNAELHSEIVNFDPECYQNIRNKAKSIYAATSEPPRLSENPAWFQCGMCKFKKYCHNL